MSWQPAHDALPQTTAASSLETVVVPRTRDLGGFEVRRVLPSIERRMVGPFVFFDEMGPTMFKPGTGIDVRPHPHIGLATVTYLFDGEILHRDNLGSVQPIRPGEINWMTAERGIALSQPPAATIRAASRRLARKPCWARLPEQYDEHRDRSR